MSATHPEPHAAAWIAKHPAAPRRPAPLPRPRRVPKLSDSARARITREVAGVAYAGTPEGALEDALQKIARANGYWGNTGALRVAWGLA